MASRGKTTQLDHMFVADFETCDADTDVVIAYDIATKKPIKEQKVWLAGYKNLETMESTYFYNIHDFMTDILARKDNMNTEYAIHNLKYDGSYIVPWLLTNGYTVTQSKPTPKEFSVLVDDRNSWYTMTIQVTARRKVTIWDSLKLFPTSLEYLPDIYSTPTRKLREDAAFYEKHRPDGHIPDAQEMAYFENDLQVPAETLNKHIELLGLRFKKTQASQAFYNFEQSFKAWKWRFPALTTEQDEAIRPAYWGGIAHVAKDKAHKDHHKIGVFDINSSYPHKAAEMKLPYGHCVAEYGEGKHPDMSKFWIAEALVEFKLKPNHLPCIPSKAISEGRPLDIDKWVGDSEGIVRMSFSNIDYTTMQASYDIKIWRWCWSMHWAWKVQKEISKFVYKNNEIKVKYKKMYNDGKTKGIAADLLAEYLAVSNRAKIDNNAFYGKFGEDIIKRGKTPYWDDVEGVTWKVDREEEQGENKRKFLPVAIAITAWGRQQLVMMANTMGEHFLYCDTDSIHYLMSGQDKIDKATADGIFEVDAEKLGAWKFEGRMVKGRYLRAKCYMEETEDGEREATVAGLPADKHSGQFSKTRSCLNWDNFHIGYVVPLEKANKLRTFRTKTGNKLLPTGFKIKEKEGLFG